MGRIRDAAALAATILAGPVTRRAVRPIGNEERQALPGDELLPEATGQWTNGVTIEARPAEIWPWLLQMGCNRAGWYSYDGIDNGCVPSAERIIPELQTVEVGDAFPWTRNDSTGFIVEALEPERSLVLGGTPPPYTLTWAFVLEPVGHESTRLISRCRGIPRNLLVEALLRLVGRPLHFGMQRRQLLNIKRLAEHAGSGRRAAPEA